MAGFFLTVYDMTGRKIRVLVNNYQHAGYYTVNFDAGTLASGFYFYTLQVGHDFIKTQRMILLR